MALSDYEKETEQKDGMIIIKWFDKRFGGEAIRYINSETVRPNEHFVGIYRPGFPKRKIKPKIYSSKKEAMSYINNYMRNN